MQLKSNAMPDQRAQPVGMQSSFALASNAWDALLSHQVSLFASAEFEHLALLDAWQASRTVLDLGCGNGDYLLALSSQFCDKTYEGWDTSDQLIDIARRRHGLEDLIFQHGPVSRDQAKGRTFDAVVMRFVVQHLTEPQVVFERLAELSHDDTLVLIIEPNLTACRAFPQMPGLLRLIERYNGVCENQMEGHVRCTGRSGLDRAVGAAWCVAEEGLVLSKHTRAAWPDLGLTGVLNGWVQALSSWATQDELKLVQEEVQGWIESKGQTIELALNIWQLRKRPAVRTLTN
jgi:SAM-dependent methyltransferase